MKDDDSGFAGMRIANYIVGGSGGSSLFKRLRDQEGLSYGVGWNLRVEPKEDGANFTVHAIQRTPNTPEVDSSFRDELARTVKDGFTADEAASANKSWHAEEMVNCSRLRDFKKAGCGNRLGEGQQFELQALEQIHQVRHGFLIDIPAVEKQPAANTREPDGELHTVDHQSAEDVLPVGVRLHRHQDQSLASLVKVALQSAKVSEEDLIPLPAQTGDECWRRARLRSKEA